MLFNLNLNWIMSCRMVKLNGQIDWLSSLAEYDILNGSQEKQISFPYEPLACLMTT